MNSQHPEDLTPWFGRGATPEEYVDLLESQLRAIHDLYLERAVVCDEAVRTVRRLPEPRRLLVITMPWCSDSVAILPVVLKLFHEEGGDAVRVLLRDENPELMNRYLTHGARAVPIVVALGEGGREAFHWGPRPAPAQAILEEHREAVASGAIDRKAVSAEIRRFYARDEGRTIVKEFVRLIDDTV